MQMLTIWGRLFSSLKASYVQLTEVWRSGLAGSWVRVLTRWEPLRVPAAGSSRRCASLVPGGCKGSSVTTFIPQMEMLRHGNSSALSSRSFPFSFLLNISFPLKLLHSIFYFYPWGFYRFSLLKSNGNQPQIRRWIFLIFFFLVRFHTTTVFYFA